VQVTADGKLTLQTRNQPKPQEIQVTRERLPDALKQILQTLVVRSTRAVDEGLRPLRAQIDDIDNQLMMLLAQRMQVCRQIGMYKKVRNLAVLQTNRYNEILEKRGEQARLCGMSAQFAAEVFEHIHEESVRQQLQVINGEVKP